MTPLARSTFSRGYGDTIDEVGVERSYVETKRGHRPPEQYGLTLYGKFPHGNGGEITLSVTVHQDDFSILVEQMMATSKSATIRAFTDYLKANLA